MKKYILLTLLWSYFLKTNAQQVIINQTHCSGTDVQSLPALYYNHTKPKYGKILGGTKYGFTKEDESKIITKLNELEKLEENSRKNFQATGCIMRVSYATLGKNRFNGTTLKGYGYQLGLYQMVCHQQQKVIKEVGEYRSVFRIDVNRGLIPGNFYGETGDFYITDKRIRYEIPINKKWDGFYGKEFSTIKLHQYMSEDQLVENRSTDYNNKHNAFLKLINGQGFTENWLSGKENANNNYKWVGRYYAITKSGIPLLTPVTRKEFLEALLEYYEIEKHNFKTASEFKAKSNKSSLAIIEADRAAYNQIYETKKARIENLLKSQSTDWLNKQTGVQNRNCRENDYAKHSNGLFDFDKQNIEGNTLLYKPNPAYFKENNTNPLKPEYFLIEFRYESGGEKQWSENIFKNFEQNFDFEALSKMLK